MKPEVSLTSSIGANWPPSISPNNRLRGFYPEYVESSQQLDEFTSEFEKGVAALEPDYVDRLSLRLITHGRGITALNEGDIKIEGVLPVAGLDVSEELFIVYTACNLPTRRMSQTKLDEHKQTITDAHQKAKTSDDPYSELRDRGRSPKFLDTSLTTIERANLTPRFLDCYAKFGYDDVQVEELLANPNNTIAYIEDDVGSVISTVMAEHAVIDIQGLPTVDMVEITEAFTLPEYRGMSFYRLLSKCLSDEVIARRSDVPVHVLYGESNLTMRGVINASAQNGRKFGHYDQSRFGISGPDFGILEQNFSVQDGVEQRDYNDFALTYFELV